MCDQPDIVDEKLADGTAIAGIYCDDWLNDFWERPFQAGSVFRPDLDVVYAMAGQDETWIYLLLQIYGLDGGKLDGLYGFEFDVDPEIDPETCGRAGPDGNHPDNYSWGHDDSPCPGKTRSTTSGVDPFDTPEMQNIRSSLKGLYPSTCRFGSFGFRVAVNTAAGGVVPVAEIPQCVAVKNWKEF